MVKKNPERKRFESLEYSLGRKHDETVMKHFIHILFLYCQLVHAIYIF